MIYDFSARLFNLFNNADFITVDGYEADVVMLYPNPTTFTLDCDDLVWQFKDQVVEVDDGYAQAQTVGGKTADLHFYVRKPFTKEDLT